MYLGRIITKSKNIETSCFIDVTNNKELAKNPEIPTLVIGKKNIEGIVGTDKVHFLDKNVGTNLYWTFAKTEQRNEFEKDLKAFKDMLLKKLVNNIEYKYLNIFTEKLTIIKRFIKFIKGNTQKVIYLSNHMIYVYCKNTIYGISLDDLQYIGIKRTKIINELKSNDNNTIITNDYFLTKDVKRYINGSKMLVPYIYFLQNV